MFLITFLIEKEVISNGYRLFHFLKYSPLFLKYSKVFNLVRL